MRLTLAVAAAAALLLAIPAVAQHSSWTMPLFTGSEFSPEFSAGELSLMIRVLELKPESQQALRDLHAGYVAQLRTEVDALKAASSAQMDRAELMSNQQLLDPVRKNVADFKKRSAQLRSTFLSDLKSLLTREQESNWPVMERELRRIRGIKNGSYAGESVDIVALTEEVLKGQPMPAPVSGLLLQYRDALDRAIVSRDAWLNGEGKDFFGVLKQDPEKATALWKEARTRRLAVRDVNERFARMIGAELPSPPREALENKLFDRSYPMLLRPSRTDLYLDDALKLDLSPDQKSQLEALAAKRKTMVRAWAREAAIGWRKLQEEEMPIHLAHALGVPNRDPSQMWFNASYLDEQHPLVQSRLRRVDLDAGHRAEIDRVLTPEQAALVPTRTLDSAKFEDWVPNGL